MIYTIRTTSGRENIVIDMVETNITARGLDVKTVVHPAELKGYIFIEGSLGDIHKSMQGVMHIRGLIEKEVKLSEIQHFFETKKAAIAAIEKDDITEIIGGPFKGEKGRVQRIDKVKDEVTVELLEASIPIPVTISTELIKLIKKGKREEAKNE